jgi:hypothetical protein
MFAILIKKEPDSILKINTSVNQIQQKSQLDSLGIAGRISN